MLKIYKVKAAFLREIVCLKKKPKKSRLKLLGDGIRSRQIERRSLVVLDRSLIVKQIKATLK
jgi:hypothetical protein